jgi:hypothetical protein
MAPPLPKEFMDCIIYRYKINKNITWIANEMYSGVRSTVYRRRKEVINYTSIRNMNIEIQSCYTKARVGSRSFLTSAEQPAYN